MRAMETDGQPHGNGLWRMMPGCVLNRVLRLQRGIDIAAMLVTCKEWHAATRAGVTALAPKSVKALRGISSCTGLKILRLQHLRDWPEVDAGSRQPSAAAQLAPLTHLTQLDMSTSETAAWASHPVAITRGDLAMVLPCLTALRELDLRGQGVLTQPQVLGGLTRCQQLTKLQVGTPNTYWQVPRSNWEDVGRMTQLVSLDISGWWGHGSGNALAASSAAAVAAAPAITPAAAAGAAAAERQAWGAQRVEGLGQQAGNPLALLSGLGNLQELVLQEADAAALDAQGFAELVQLHNLRVLDLSGGSTGLLEGLGAAYAAAQAASDHRAPSLRQLQQPALSAPLQQLGHNTKADGTMGLLPPIRVQPCGYDADNNNGAARTAGILQQQLFHPLLPMPRSPAAVAAAQRAAAAVADLNNAAAAAVAAGVGSSSGSSSGVKYPRTHTGDEDSEKAAKRRRRQRLMQLAELRLNSSLQLVVTGQKLAPFSNLVRLEVAGAWSFEGLGSVQLPLLQYLNLAAVQHVDYQSVRRILLTSPSLVFLDLSEAALELRGPSSSSSSAAYTDSDLLGQACAGTYALPYSSPSRPGSRRASSSEGGGVAESSRVDGGMVVGGAHGVEGGPPRALLAISVKGLREVWLPEANQLLAGAEAQAGTRLEKPSLVLDLLASPGLRLKELHAGGCPPVVTQKLLRLLEGQEGLEVLDLEGAGAPADSSSWSRLRHLSNMRELNLNYVMPKRAPYVHTGNCATQQVLQMSAAFPRLRSLKLAGWRFYFSKLHPLAPLAGSLKQLDLSNATGLTDSTLWSLTHLTGLTSLSLDYCSPTSDRIFDLLFEHMPEVQQLSLRGCQPLTAHSIPALLKLRHLSSLNLSDTHALPVQALSRLTGLSELRSLWLSLGQQEGWRPEDLACFGSSQSLRWLSMGSGAALADGVRQVLPPWVNVR